MKGRLSRLAAYPFVSLVRAYQILVSPLLPPTCRYYPSCSSYAVRALSRHGLGRGAMLALRRLARCHPWALGGIDHVPALPGQPADADLVARRLPILS